MQNTLYEYIDQKFINLTPQGSGGRQTVWLAQDVETKRIVIKKYISLENAEVYERLKSIRHKSLVPVLYLAKGARGAVVILEYVSGQTIGERMETQGLFHEKDAVSYMIQLLRGLYVVHQAGIVHRDIKPDNLLISTDGILKILDFDISRIYKKHSRQDTQLNGTQGYAAPEQLGHQQTDARSDIYASGVLMNVMLTGCRPNEQPYTDNKAIHTIIRRCFEISPENRYQSSGKMLQALERLQAFQRWPADRSAPDTSAHRTGIWPGFRTGVRWKQIIASIYYVLMSIYSASCLYLCWPNPLALFLETVAVAAHIWLAVFLPLNFPDWMRLVPPVQRLGRIPKIILGMMLWMILFMTGATLDQYVSVNMMHLSS